MIRGVLFDMDGLMFDTERIGHRGWKYGAQVLGLELPDELDYDTLGGMVFSCLHTIPQDGTPLDVECLGLHVHVDAVQGRRIPQAQVSRVQTAE